ncbi:cystathionine gamma-synthase family protein [Flavihumibacter stibioxidans]|uniref:Methionine gamma-lyase n=1 Tax=Flavihumibacter stibioxidans TaxID=1834163 RepID=A0ABR7MCD0_9BACT|nr:cystathionine gamma-synthase family protein [Flavihumibacter stibioxidans]MBC6492703.1 methionine gamma-lyase [Flavihumibacter stibioxidans]
MIPEKIAPETAMMGFGYFPEWSEGAVKCPMFQTSTFVFPSAEAGKSYFEKALGRPGHENEPMGLIYSRINNPGIEILENRLRLWDEAEAAAVFSSGMSAISTTLLAFLRPGDVLLYSNPLYGGTHKFVHQILPAFGVEVIGFRPHMERDEIIDMLQASGHAARLRMVYVETPANPTNDLIDIRMAADIARQFSTAEKQVLTVVDNTYMGPIWQHPLQLGADIVLYSATKYLGGHSDLIAGSAAGNTSLMTAVKRMRTVMGTNSDPHTAWLLLRSLETLRLRMNAAEANARVIADWLVQHPEVIKVIYLGHLDESHGDQYSIFKRQCKGNGAMISFIIKGGEKGAFRFLNHLHHIKLAVSLGGTESLAEHPGTMTHADVPDEEKLALGIVPGLVRLSVGVERVEDLIADLEQALEVVNSEWSMVKEEKR